MDLYEALYTTRAMRRVSPDPISDETLATILDAAIRAPSGGNSQNWRMLLVTDGEQRAGLGPLYRDAFEQLQNTVYKRSWARAKEEGDEAVLRVMRSSAWLAENFEQVPAWLFFFTRNDPSGASIYPAVWSAMLAARGRDIGTCLTTILGVFKTPEVFELLGVPGDKGWVLAAAVSCGHPLGRWDIAPRKPVEHVTYSNHWGDALTFQVNGPLWG